MFRLRFLLSLLTFTLFCQAQHTDVQENKNGWSAFIGTYQVDFYPERKMVVAFENGSLTLEVVGQGKTMLIPAGDRRFEVKGLANTFISFNGNKDEKSTRFTWDGPPIKGEWKQAVKFSDSVAGPLNIYSGRYNAGSNRRIMIDIHVKDGQLTSQIPGETGLTLTQTEKDHFVYTKNKLTNDYLFVRNKGGDIKKLLTTQSGEFDCLKTDSVNSSTQYTKHILTDRSHFTAADTLMGSQTPFRTNYDVLFYDLSMNFNPDSKSLEGKNIIRFKVLRRGDTILIDLFKNMQIDQMLWKNKAVRFRRQGDAVFVSFPEKLQTDSIEELSVSYHGVPQEADISTLRGGMIWAQDNNGQPWFESVCQGSGASLWWPCKDQLADKPDSMHIRVTVPKGIVEVSNGMFLGKTELAGGIDCFEWKVSYPINTYDVVVYGGDYVYKRDDFNSNRINFPINYYFLKEHAEQASSFFKQVKPMLAGYEQLFGPYPFQKDGFALVESPYGMEHQSAVSMGPLGSFGKAGHFDTASLRYDLWHESAHEWWGNSVTCSDYADFWIHESFATYAEYLLIESYSGYPASLELLQKEKGNNTEPIIGYYGVNDFHMDDVYGKGCRMLATFRNVLSNDTLWFQILKGIQSTFQYKTITTTDLIDYINKKSGKDFTYFFDQYLRFAALPELNLVLEEQGKNLSVKYKWKANVLNFDMPVKVSVGRDKYEFISPGTTWQTQVLKNLNRKQFKVDTENFYISVKSQ